MEEKINKVLNSVLKTKYPDLTFDSSIYLERDKGFYDFVMRYNIFVDGPKSKYTTYSNEKASEQLLKDIKELMRTLGIFSNVHIFWS